MGYVILLWDSLSLPYNYFAYKADTLPINLSYPVGAKNVDFMYTFIRYPMSSFGTDGCD